MKLMTKRIISLLLAFVMLFSMVPMMAFATEETEVTKFSNVMEDTGEIEDSEESEVTESSGTTEETEATETTEATEAEESEVIHEHDYEAVVTELTCTEQGYTTYTCECGESYVDGYIEALAHDYLESIIYPTGGSKGYMLYTCSQCGDSYRTSWLDKNAYEGKSIACVGDSITAAYGVTKDENDYVKVLADQLGMDYIRLGASGTTLCTDGSRTCNISRLTEGYLKGADVVTIAMGINDFCAAAEEYYELGDIDSTDSSTIYGAVKMWCERIEELRKTDSLSDTQFYFVTPVITSWNNSVTSKKNWDQSKTNIHGYTLRDLCNAIIEVAALYDVAVIDLNLLSGMYYVDAEDNNTAIFGGDGVHPGIKGHEMMATAMANVLLQNELRNDHTHTFGSWITTTWPSCYEGEQQRVCSACSAIESRALEYTHEYTSTVTAPTCTEQGYTTYTCVCGESYADSYVDATGHTYENGICVGCSVIASPYLQQLPENIIGCTNLYSILTPVKGYYTATKYDTSNGAVLSVVIPVEPGDRIASSSFGPVTENMGSVNGIRVTYLLDGTIVESLSASSVYTAYTQDGYLTVPAGVNMVCVPWWNPSDSNWLTLSQISKNFVVHSPKYVSAQAPTCTENGYTAGEICEICNVALGTRESIPSTGHDYNGNTCTICGTVNVLAILDGKYVSVLGDSISTFNGYSNDATVNTTIGGNGPRYDAGIADTKPGSYCLLESVDDTWWMHFANRSGMNLLVNNSWAGSQVLGGQTTDGRVIPAAYLERCINLHDNTIQNNPNNEPINPDVIFVYLGINDYNFNRNNVGEGAVDYATLINSDGTYVTPTTFAEAYGILLHKMKKAYPDAQIFAMTLLPENLYSVNMTAWGQHNAFIRAAAEYYDIPVIDLAENCAITWENYSSYMMDKIHPTTAGMKLISDCIEAELVAYYKENPPHTHSYTVTATAPTCTEQGYTTYTCDCGDSYADDYVDATGHCRNNGICINCGDTLNGKKVSILSHSMSTYAGVSNSTEANSTLGNNDVYYTEGRHDVYRKDTWWQQTIDALGMELLVNNSWSGSCVFMPRKGEASVGYSDRAVNLHNDHTGEEPDIIFVYLGCNDFAYYQDTFGKAADVDYAALIRDNGDETYTYVTPVTTCEAYAIMLHKVQNRYPDAEIYCMTSTARRETDYTGDSYPDAGQPTEYSSQLQQIAKYYGYPVIDLENAIAKDVDVFDKYMGDKRAHANALGMDQITNEVLSVMLDRDTEICHVISDDGTVQEQAVLLGGSYCAEVELQEGYNVVVTMNREDITSEVYGDGKIYIDKVVGDIEVYTTIQRNPLNFCWKIQEDALVSVGDSDNVATQLAGTVTNGVMDNTRYRLATPVVLKHDLPWEVEWKFAGNWRGCVFTSNPDQSTKGMVYLSRTVGGQLSFGTWTGAQYDNYGVDLSYLDDQVHAYRLVNRIADDGSNMVWVYVDGKEIGPMNHYYIGSKDQGKNSDWISAKDFVFSYISMDGHALKNCKLDYLQVQECVHTYEYGTCTACGEAQPGPIITKQPENTEVGLGECFCALVEAEGEGLKYQWYFRNAGTEKWYKSSVKDNTYDDIMTKARAGREIYCVITDANGNSVTTEVAKLIAIPSQKLEIITQPVDGSAVLGEKYCVNVEAKGDSLKYQWYFRNAGTEKWYKSSVKDNTYDDIMTKARAGREIYCVITDAVGNSVKTDIVELVQIPVELEIISQPADAAAHFGEMFCATVEAKGDGLKYQWYFRNAGSDKWHKSGVRDNTYDDIMIKARMGREIYCVITDQWGNRITTDTVKLIAVPSVELKILSQSYESAVLGERYCATVEVQGEGLKFQWYFRNANTEKWYKSGVRDNTYDDVMTKARANRDVYCVITDVCGNQVTTEVMTIHPEK